MNIFKRIKSWFTKKQLSLKLIKGNFPANMRYFDADKRKIVVECCPGKRMVIRQNSDGRTNASPVCLYFPYTYFIISYRISYPEDNKIAYIPTDIFIGFSKEQIYHSSRSIGTLPLSNRTSFLGFCLGHYLNDMEGYPDTLEKLSNLIVSAFWQRAFNSVLISWVDATKVGNGSKFVEKELKKSDKLPIKKIIGENTVFFNYVVEKPEPKKPKKIKTVKSKKKKFRWKK